MSGEVALRNLYIRERRAAALQTCSVVNVTPLLRELIVRTTLVGALDAAIPAQKRLIGVILDELKLLTAVPLQLPLPRDPRAAQFAALAEGEPGGKAPTRKMLRQCGASRRTLDRLFRAETAMSLGQWLRRQKLMHALRLLAAGEGVNAIALELGYNSASAFIAMFRRELGQTPMRYFET
jgi:AraC-like DNA-binding protein